ncbi:MAG: Fic family protein [Imperialibacter sp.]|uniref:Fic family protein n=1 Tax=Imperialibacter sp. TaxID=2038411 RepID=UPI0032EE370A
MTWNWQHKEWPQFKYRIDIYEGYERDFLHRAGIMFGSMKHIGVADQDVLKVDLMSNEAFKTSEIEGEFLNRESLQSSIRRQFGLKTDSQRRITPAEEGIAELMIDLYRTYNAPLDESQLFSWHEMLTSGRRDLLDIGTYRTHEDPMQVVSGALSNPKVHYEAPPSSRVKKEMDTFIAWFNATNQPSSNPLSPLVRAGIAHLYFESIHPFEDGNGRIGRAISEKALSQALGKPTLIAISHVIESNKKEYYEALQNNSTSLAIDQWLEYFCHLVIQAQSHTQSTIDFLIEKGKFFNRFSNALNPRQAKVIERIFKEGINGFKGGLSAENYIRITQTTASTATRDLQNLAEQGALKRTGVRKGTRYYLNIDHESTAVY